MGRGDSTVGRGREGKTKEERDCRKGKSREKEGKSELRKGKRGT
jgi:hypothetical protein